MRALTVTVLLLGSTCTTEALVCGRMETLCGTSRDACEQLVKETRDSMGEQGVEDLKTCFAKATSCTEAGGCMAGKGLKAVGKQLEGFFKGLVKGLEDK